MAGWLAGCDHTIYSTKVQDFFLNFFLGRDRVLVEGRLQFAEEGSWDWSWADWHSSPASVNYYKYVCKYFMCIIILSEINVAGLHDDVIYAP